MSQIYVALLALEVVERGHAEVHAHGIALDDGGQERFAPRTDERSDVDVAFADVTGDGRADRGVAQGQFRLCQVGLAHDHRRYGAFVGGDGVVQVELARRILLEKRTDALQVAFRFQLEGLVFLQLGTGAVCAGLVELRVDDEEHLVLINISTLLEKHLFEVALDAGAYLDELLRTDAAYVFAVDLHVFGGYGFHHHGRVDFRLGPLAEDKIERCRHCGQHDDSRNELAFGGLEFSFVLLSHGRAHLYVAGDRDLRFGF